MKNLISIMENGIKPSSDGIVYLTQLPDEAVMFLVFRGLSEIVVIAVKLDTNSVGEVFDHNPSFFRCRAYGYRGQISSDKIVMKKCMKFNLSRLEEIASK